MFSEWFKKILWLFFIVLILFVVIFQLKKTFLQENIVFYNVKNEVIYSQEKYFNLRGKAYEIKKIYLNDKEYFLDEENNFNIELYLFNGVNNFILKAIKRNGDILEKKITILHEK